MNTWVFIAAYNEEQTIGAVIDDVKTITPNVVVVDDCSIDHTGDIARQHGAVVLRHVLNRGKGAAIRTGTAYALAHGADVIMHFDADGQHHAKDIPTLIAPLERCEAGVVLGSRFLEESITNISRTRKTLLKLGIFFTWWMSGIRLTDAHNGLRAFSRSAAERIILTEDRFAYASELVDEIRRLELRYTEVPVTITYTDYSLAKGQRSANAFAIAGKMIWKKLLT